ncbi:MAG TPA: nitroreductase family protein [bacterium]|nr:nitroreductase family protein [bacterium]HQI50298.1 nitroreductase family protein [bacterium]HQJ65747.1 nitroreductase family protein [bacterium]
MELVQAIEVRRTVRKFANTPVSADLLRELARRAGLAPRVNNAHFWKFIAVTQTRLIQDLAAAVHQRIAALFADTTRAAVLKTVDHFSTVFEGAPAVLFLAMQPYKAIADDLEIKGVDHEALNAMRRHPDLQSAGAAVQNILLSAAELGLGACWLSGMMVARPELEKLLHVQAPWELVTAVAVGKPETVPAARPHPSLEEIFTLIA